MTLRLLHLANHGGRNVGNAALILGLERVLSEDIAGDLTFVAEPWDLYSRGVRRFDEAFVDRVNREADVLLVGAAVAFDGGAQYTNTGFRFDLPLPLWDRLTVPIVFYGLSHRMLPHRRFHNPDALRRTLDRIVTDDRILFAARADGTKQWLEGMLGRPSERIHEVPDPAIFVPVEDSWHPELATDRPNVLVAVNAEDEDFRWALGHRRRTLRRPDLSSGLRGLAPIGSSWGWREHRAAFVHAFTTGLARALDERGANIIFCAHDTFDVGMSYEISQRLPHTLQYDCAFASAALLPDKGRYFYDLYAKADLAISMRIHSMNPAIGLGTPVVPVVTGGRMRRFMADAGLSDLCVDAHADDVAVRLPALASAALDDPGAQRKRLAAATAALRERAAAFNRQVGSFIGSA